MGFGRKLPDGYLPVFSVNTEDEAKRLITLTCPMGLDGHYYARELAESQTVENLLTFSDKLARAWALMKERQP